MKKNELVNEILKQMEEEFNADVEVGLDEAGDELDRKVASGARGEQAQTQLHAVWDKVLKTKDLSLMDDETLGKLIKSNLDDRTQSSLINVLSKGLSLEPVADKNKGTFMRQRHITDSKEYANLNVMRESFIKELRVLLENEVEQAEVLVASQGFSEELQVMIEKLGRLMNEKLPPVIDQMRLAYGSDQADVFGETMRSDMQTILDTMLAVKENIDHAVVAISQGKMPHEYTDMDADGDLSDTAQKADIDMEQPTDLESDLSDLADEFGGEESMAGPEDDPLGRAKKESFNDLRNQLIEMKCKLAEAKKNK